MDEKNNKNSKKKEDCPLCKVSEDTIKKLKEKEQFRKGPEDLQGKKKEKSFSKFKIILLVFVIILGGFVFYQFSLQSAPQLEENKASILDIFPESFEVGDLAPVFASEDVYGNKISLSDFRGKSPVLLVFWATWCGYCAKELPELKAFVREHQGEIQVIAVDSGEPRETIRNYITEKDINFLILLDEDRKIWNQYFIRGTPSHFFISSQGKIVALRPGLASKEDLEIMMIMLTPLENLESVQ